MALLVLLMVPVFIALVIFIFIGEIILDHFNLTRIQKNVIYMLFFVGVWNFCGSSTNVEKKKPLTPYETLSADEKIVYDLVKQGTQNCKEKWKIRVEDGFLYEFGNKEVLLTTIRTENKYGNYVDTRYYIDSTGKAINLSENEEPNEVRWFLKDKNGMKKYRARRFGSSNINKVWKKEHPEEKKEEKGKLFY